MASANTSEKVPPDKVQEKSEDAIAVKRAPSQDESSTSETVPAAKRMRHHSPQAAVLTESPLEPKEETPPQSPSHGSTASFPSEIPPAPPSTPASVTDMKHYPPHDASVDSLPGIVENASALEQQQRQALLEDDMVATPAPPRPATTGGSSSLLKDDFSDWAVGTRYQMLRMLGRGSYGEVAQAKDLLTGNFVAIKRITSAFDQEVDAIRLYREMHILRGLRGHECIIQLMDVVQPPSEDLNDFHDLYLVFECTCIVPAYVVGGLGKLILITYSC